MKLIKKKYRKLRPTMDYLADEVIMAQSWKKTQNYMRTRNWYADTLSLDISAVGLHKNAKKWADEIRDEENIPLPIELIPAPKSEKWKIDKDDGWLPVKVIDNKHEERMENPPLRPLANIDIRDQTWATSVMLCLADAVETAQGNCSSIYPTNTRIENVYSYGNRLVCDWKEGDGWFRWGNAETYRKYYIDYQQFLKRPLDVGKFVASTRVDEENIYIINLDISKFYDNIDRNLLIQRLINISEDYHGDEGDEEDKQLFWSTVQKVFSWFLSVNSQLTDLIEQTAENPGKVPAFWVSLRWSRINKKTHQNAGGLPCGSNARHRQVYWNPIPLTIPWARSWNRSRTGLTGIRNCSTR